MSCLFCSQHTVVHLGVKTGQNSKNEVNTRRLGPLRGVCELSKEPKSTFGLPKNNTQLLLCPIEVTPLLTSKKSVFLISHIKN